MRWYSERSTAAWCYYKIIGGQVVPSRYRPTCPIALVTILMMMFRMGFRILTLLHFSIPFLICTVSGISQLGFGRMKKLMPERNGSLVRFPNPAGNGKPYFLASLWSDALGVTVV